MLTWLATAVLGVVPLNEAYVQTFPGEVQALSGNVFLPQLSRNGRYALLVTGSEELDPTDTNELNDVYRIDRATGAVLRVSAPPGGVANGASDRPDLSASGSAVAFHSAAGNLFAGDDNGSIDVFLWRAAGGDITLISINLGGQVADGVSLNPALADNERFVAFSSTAPDLVPDDTNEASDIFVRDLELGQTFRVSVASDGSEGDAGSIQPTISADGRYVAFVSEATNLSDLEFDQLPDIFLHDRVTGSTELINVSSTGVRSNADSSGPAISPDGSAVGFYSRATTLESGLENIFFDIFVRDLLSLRTELISNGPAGAADANSFNPSLSARGLWVAFQSEADNLSPADTNEVSDIYLRQRETGELRVASRRPSGATPNDGSFAAALVPSGAEVAFQSIATNLDQAGVSGSGGFAAAAAGGAVQRLARVPGPGMVPNASLDQVITAGRGRFLWLVTVADNLVSQDGNGSADAFVLDRLSGTLRLLTRGADGLPLSGAGLIGDGGGVSADGCRSVWVSDRPAPLLGVNPALVDANGLGDVFLRDDCRTGPVEVISASDAAQTGAGVSDQAVISADGEWIAFSSAGHDLVAPPAPAGVRQIYRRSLGDGSLERITSGSADSHSPQLSGDGATLVFVSGDEGLDLTLASGQRPAPGVDQVYRWDAESGQVQLLSRPAAGAPDGPANSPRISADGETAVFVSAATNLVAAAFPGTPQLLRWEAATGLTGYLSPGGGSGASQQPLLSADGALVMFLSEDDGWSTDDNNARSDIVALDLDSQESQVLSLSYASPLAPAGLAVQDAAYEFSFLALVEGTAQLVVQQLTRSVPALTVDAFVSSPLQSVEAGRLRLQVRNTGAVPIRVEDGLQVVLDPLGHPLAELGPTPGWQCLPGPPVTCSYEGYDETGRVLAPLAAAPLYFDFQMFSGPEPLTTVASATLARDPGPAPSSAALVTDRVESGVFWRPAASEVLAPGESGVAAVSVINGGQQPVAQVVIDMAPFSTGEPEHVIRPAPEAPWTCADLNDPKFPPRTRRCVYSGPPLLPDAEIRLESELVLPPGVGLLRTRLALASDAQVVTPRGLQIMTTQAPELIFRGTFE